MIANSSFATGWLVQVGQHLCGKQDLSNICVHELVQVCRVLITIFYDNLLLQNCSGSAMNQDLDFRWKTKISSDLDKSWMSVLF